MKKLIFCLAVLLSGCSSYRYYAVSNEPLQSGKYQTFAWIPDGDAKSSALYNNDIATDKIVNAASKEMENRGFKLQNSEPDLLLRFTAKVTRNVKEYQEPVYYNPPAVRLPRVAYYNGRRAYYYTYVNPMPIYVGERERTVRVKENSIMLDIIDRKTSKVVWRGWAEGELNNPQKAIEEIPAVIAGIFKKLP